MGDYNERLHIFVEWGQVDQANSSAKSWDPDAGGEDTFGGIRLSEDGEEPPTHSMASTLVTEDMKAQVLNAMEGRKQYDLYYESEGWSWRDALEDMGLQRITNNDQ